MSYRLFPYNYYFRRCRSGPTSSAAISIYKLMSIDSVHVSYDHPSSCERLAPRQTRRNETHHKPRCYPQQFAHFVVPLNVYTVVTATSLAPLSRYLTKMQRRKLKKNDFDEVGIHSTQYSAVYNRRRAQNGKCHWAAETAKNSFFPILFNNLDYATLFLLISTTLVHTVSDHL